MSLFDQPLRQPDQRSCGAAVLVVHELLRRPAYAALAGAPLAFRAEVLAMHRRVTSPVDVRGMLQLPWPQSLGTPPWAVARQLTGTTGVRHDVHWAGPDRAATFDGLVAHVTAGRPVPVYVGSTWLPRHVVLAVDSPGAHGLRVYDPSSGALVVVTRERFVAARLGLAGWDRPWFVVTPA
jgi:hypothetical protein